MEHPETLCGQCFANLDRIKTQINGKLKQIQSELNEKLVEIGDSISFVNSHLNGFIEQFLEELLATQCNKGNPITGLKHSVQDVVTRHKLDYQPLPLESSTFPEITRPTSPITSKGNFVEKRSRASAHRPPERTMPAQKDIFICDICSKIFNDKYTLQTHRNTHNSANWLCCDICRKTFTRKHSLVVHMRTHTGERPYMCHQCCKTFAQHPPFRRHMQTHAGKKPHKCNICDKSFGQKVHLAVHLQSHTGERPHVCPVCKKGYTKRYHVRRHLQRFHSCSNVDAIFPCRKAPTNNDY